MNPHQHDDPRLTAFALGELPADEQAEIEAQIATDDGARHEVDETRQLAGILSAAFAQEVAVPADPAVTDAVDEALSRTPAAAPEFAAAGIAPDVIEVPASRFRWWPALGAIAATLVAVAGIWAFLPEKPAAKMKLAAAQPPSVVPAQNLREPAAEPVPTAPGGAGIGAATVVQPGVPAEQPSKPVSADWWSVGTLESDAGRRSAALNAASASGRPGTSGVRVDPLPGASQAGPAGDQLATSYSLAAPSPVPPPEQSSQFRMQPELIKRYGLSPNPGQAPVPTGTGLAGGATGAGRGAVPESRDTPGGANRRGFASRATTAPASSLARSGTGSGSLDVAARKRQTLADAMPPSSPAPGGPPPMNPEMMRRYGLASEPGSMQRPLHMPLPTPMPPPFPRSEDYYSIDRSSPESQNPGYVDAGDNPFISPLTQPLSTLSLDVDTGSYANVRRFLNAGMFPPRGAVRVEELINYFPYRYSAPHGDDVFGVQTEVGMCPWEPHHRLVRVALKAREISGDRPAGNLVFLIDISGSMQPGERLPLIKQGLRALVKRLSPVDRVAIVTYASSAGIRLESTSCEQKDRILEAIDSLEAGGSTNGEGGIRQAYEVARGHLIPGGVNRVLLCTDGDFNVGISDQNELVRLIEEQARSGVFLTTLGVGTDNFKDALMRRLADRGNGSYHYLDSHEEAQRVLLEQMDATFVTVARDAKAQVEFNPARVAAWRLIGYEKRLLAAQDFNDDTKDAGEVGAGQAVTVLYEIVPVGERVPGTVDPLKYQVPEAKPASARAGSESKELLTLKLRYQRPEGSKSMLKEFAVEDREREPGGDFKFAAAVAAFGMTLRDPSWDGGRGFDRALTLAQGSLGEDPGGWRAEFLTLVRKARGMPRR